MRLVKRLGKLVAVLNMYKGGKKIHIVMDNLNTHFRRSFEEEIGK